MAIDPSAVGATSASTEVAWTSTDALLYSLGVGAGVDELAFSTENTAGVPQQALPTMAVTFGRTGANEILGSIGDFNRRGMVHGEQQLVVHAPLAIEGRVRVVSELTGIYDKGSGATLAITTRAQDEVTGDPTFTLVMPLFVRGEGGFGGEGGPSGPTGPEDRRPDARFDDQTSTDQALLYRLSGDRNPLHSVPGVANRAGFDRPILHGWCTFGFAGRAAVGALCGGDAARLTGIRCRFAAPVVPGEALSTSFCRTGEGEAAVETVGGDGRVVLSSGLVQYEGEA